MTQPTKQQVTTTLANLFDHFLSRLPPKERARRIRNFGKAISVVKSKRNTESEVRGN